MPIRRKQDIELTAQQLEHLVQGWCVGALYPFKDDDDRRRLWFTNRDYLMGLIGVGRIPGAFASLKKNEKPQGWHDYEGNGKNKGDYTRQMKR